MVMTSADVVQEGDIYDLVEQAREETIGFRTAFNDGGTQTGPTVDVKVAPSEMFDREDYEHVPENAEYPRADPARFTDLQATVHKRGFESVVTDEAVARNQLPQQLAIARGQADAQERALDAVAGSLLTANLSGTTAGNADGILTWSDVLDARTQMRANDYNPDLLLVEPYGVGDVLENIAQRETRMGDDAIRSGVLFENLLGMEWRELTTDSPAVPQNGAIMLDTSRYGYEFNEDLGGGNVSSYREENRDRTVYKVRDSRGWLVTDSGAGMLIDG